MDSKTSKILTPIKVAATRPAVTARAYDVISTHGFTPAMTKGKQGELLLVGKANDEGHACNAPQGEDLPRFVDMGMVVVRILLIRVFVGMLMLDPSEEIGVKISVLGLLDVLGSSRINMMPNTTRSPAATKPITSEGRATYVVNRT